MWEPVPLGTDPHVLEWTSTPDVRPAARRLTLRRGPCSVSTDVTGLPALCVLACTWALARAGLTSEMALPLLP